MNLMYEDTSVLDSLWAVDETAHFITYLTRQGYSHGKNKVSIALCSDLGYEGMVVDIKYGKTRIVLAPYDKGIDAIEINWFPSNKPENSQSYPLLDLVAL